MAARLLLRRAALRRGLPDGGGLAACRLLPGAFTFAFAAASFAFSCRCFSVSRMRPSAALATPACWSPPISLRAAKKACATIFVPRGARDRTSCLGAMIVCFLFRSGTNVIAKKPDTTLEASP